MKKESIMVVIYGKNRTIREFGKDSGAAWALAAELMARGQEVWVLSKRQAHIYELA